MKSLYLTLDLAVTLIKTLGNSGGFNTLRIFNTVKRESRQKILVRNSRQGLEISKLSKIYAQFRFGEDRFNKFGYYEISN